MEIKNSKKSPIFLRCLPPLTFAEIFMKCTSKSFSGHASLSLDLISLPENKCCLHVVIPPGNHIVVWQEDFQVTISLSRRLWKYCKILKSLFQLLQLVIMSTQQSEGRSTWMSSRRTWRFLWLIRRFLKSWKLTEWHTTDCYELMRKFCRLLKMQNPVNIVNYDRNSGKMRVLRPADAD